MIAIIIGTILWLGVTLEDKEANKECLKILRSAESGITEYQHQNIVAKYKQCLLEN